MNKIIGINNVSLTYCTLTEETEALQNVSFDINEGEFIAVVGPSGCGKTTLLSLLSGTLKPTHGSIDFVLPCKIGYMLQHDHLFEWRSLYKNLLLGPEIEGAVSPEVQAYVSSLLKKYGLDEFKSSRPHRLSGGMRQRAALIRTLALKPDLLLLDEPFSALDFQTRLHVCNDVYAIIKNEGKTALLVTHDISEALSMADKIVVLSKRPATVQKLFIPSFDKALSPLERREAPNFSSAFQELWNDISQNSITSV